MAFVLLPVLGLICDVVGLILHIVGVATPEWSVEKDVDITHGLWEDCLPDDCSYLSSDDKELFDGKLETAEAFAVLGIVFAIVAVFPLVIFVVFSCLDKNASRIYCFVSGAMAFISVLFIAICFLIWGAQIHKDNKEDFGYSFALSVSGAILLLCGGILVTVAGKLLKS